jgi:hypothetical protein
MTVNLIHSKDSKKKQKNFKTKFNRCKLVNQELKSNNLRQLVRRKEIRLQGQTLYTILECHQLLQRLQKGIL